MLSYTIINPSFGCVSRQNPIEFRNQRTKTFFLYILKTLTIEQGKLSSADSMQRKNESFLLCLYYSVCSTNAKEKLFEFICKINWVYVRVFFRLPLNYAADSVCLFHFRNILKAEWRRLHLLRVPREFAFSKLLMFLVDFRPKCTELFSCLFFILLRLSAFAFLQLSETCATPVLWLCSRLSTGKIYFPSRFKFFTMSELCVGDRTRTFPLNWTFFHFLSEREFFSLC